MSSSSSIRLYSVKWKIFPCSQTSRVALRPKVTPHAINIYVDEPPRRTEIPYFEALRRVGKAFEGYILKARTEQKKLEAEIACTPCSRYEYIYRQEQQPRSSRETGT